MSQDYSIAGIPASFSNATPTRILWVDASAKGTGDGSAGAPFTTIQAAVNKATPGTAIMVKEGVYTENVNIPRTVSGTDGAPIWLVSADGQGKAHVVAPDNSTGAIVGGGTENFVVDGFHVTGGKNGIQFSQNGFDYTDTIKNIVVQNNIIDGIVEDGVKLNGGTNTLVQNNVITGGNDESIDYVSIVHGVIQNNEVSGNTGTSAAIFAKAGSEDIKILNNYIHDSAADGISVGGWSNPNYVNMPGYEGYEAKDVLVQGNRVESVGKRPLSFYGAQNATATGNYLVATDKYYTVVHVGVSNVMANGQAYASSNITVTDNFITRATKTLFTDATSTNVTFANNANAAATAVDAGAHSVSSALADLLSSLKGLGGGLFSLGDAILSAPVAANADAGATPLKSAWATSAIYANVASTSTGTAAADLLKDKGGLIAGGAGDDSYQVNGAAMGRVVEKAGDGVDTVLGSGRFLALTENVENLLLQTAPAALLIGNGLDNVIKGNAGNDFIVGGGGSNLLAGGGGSDTFFVDKGDALTHVVDFVKGDVLEIAGNPFASFADMQAAMKQVGADTVVTLGDGRSIVLEKVAAASLTAADFDFSGGGTAQSASSAVNKVMVSAATHVATGTAGADLVYGTGGGVLAGGAGNDGYILKIAGDHIVEKAGGGIDTVMLYMSSYTMENNVEDVKVKIDTGATVFGNGLANVITGGGGADMIRGGAGADLLTGGDGADKFVYGGVKEGGDTITDFVGGTDRIDLTAVHAQYANLKVTTVDTGAGLQVYADHGTGHDLIATLTGVHALASGDIVM